MIPPGGWKVYSNTITVHNKALNTLYCLECFGFGYKLNLNSNNIQEAQTVISAICEYCSGRGIPPIPLNELIGYESD